jgi:hypothetical protein
LPSLVLKIIGRYITHRGDAVGFHRRKAPGYAKGGC